MSISLKKTMLQSSLTAPLVKAAAKRAADWLEANRDKHIRGRFAEDANGFRVSARSEDATCFCALGRFLHELPDELIGPTSAVSFDLLLAVLGDRLVLNIQHANDDDPADGNYSATNRGAGMAGVLALREISK